MSRAHEHRMGEQRPGPGWFALSLTLLLLPLSGRGSEAASPSTLPAKASPTNDAFADLDRAVKGSSSDGARPVATNEIAPENLNEALIRSHHLIPSSNIRVPEPDASSETPNYEEALQEALKAKAARNYAHAEKLFVRILEGRAPVELQKTAMLELAVLAQEEENLARAQQIYTQFLRTYAADPAAPEILLRQGLLYRQMGAPVLALSKFYSVMSTALNLKTDRFPYYQRLVLLAQSEIAETYYLQGKYDEAIDFFGRLLKLDSPDLDRAKIHYKLIRSYWVKGRYADLAANVPAFLDKYPDASYTPEIRFLYAGALKKLGRNREAMEQVLALLASEQKGAARDPKSWNYWRQRTGNEIGNQLYEEGDYLNALQVYQALAQLSTSAEWQVQALYQVGLIYERLQQLPKAIETYERILAARAKLEGKPIDPALTAVLDMAKWRRDFLKWQEQAGESTRKLHIAADAKPTHS